MRLATGGGGENTPPGQEARVATDRTGSADGGRAAAGRPDQGKPAADRPLELPPHLRQAVRGDHLHTVLPATVQGIRRYRGSGLIKGIGR